MQNLFRRFQALIPDEPILYAEIITHNADGSSTVETPQGGQFRVRGQSVAVGDFAYLQGGRIIEEAPALPSHEVTV